MLGELGLEGMSPLHALVESTRSSAVPWSSSPTPSKGSFKKTDTKYEDTLDLSNDLRNAAEQCQLLAQRLKKKGEDRIKASELKVETPITSSFDVGQLEEQQNVCCAALDQKLKDAESENIRLRQVVKDVTGINKRWQKYNGQQQDYLKRILAENRKFQEEKAEIEVQAILRRCDCGRKDENATSSSAKKLPNPLTFRHSDSSLIDNNAVVSALRQSYENAVKENCRLEKELEECKNREAALKANLDEKCKSHAEQLELLGYQLKIHKEDWEAEKAEKEQEKEKNQRQIEELQQLKLKNRNFTDRLNIIEQTCRCTTSGDFETINHAPSVRSLRRQHSFCPAIYSRRTSLVCDGSSKPSQEQLFQSRDGATNVKEEIVKVDSATVSERQDCKPVSRNDSFQLVDFRSTNVVVECPGCSKEFPTEQHLNFLDHFEECQPK